MIKVQASVSKGWLHTEGGFDFDTRYYMEPTYRMKQDRACHEFICERFPGYPIYNMEDNLVQAEYVVPDMILVGAIQPNLIIAAALGSEFVFAPDKDSDVKGLPLKDINDPSDLPAIEDVLSMLLMEDLCGQYSTIAQKHPGQTVIPPFFWDTSGRATIHGIATTSMKFIGQDIFVDMITRPELVEGIHDWITEVYIALIDKFSKLGHLPVTSVHVGECSGTMLDADSYRKFVTPYISRLGRRFGAVRLHSCGNADHVIGPICEIENLEIIDTGSNTSLAEIRRKMGGKFEINVFPPVEVLLPDAGLEQMKEWLDRTLFENDGGNLKIEYHLEPEYSWENCRYIHEELARLGIVAKGRLY